VAIDDVPTPATGVSGAKAAIAKGPSGCGSVPTIRASVARTLAAYLKAALRSGY